MGKYVFTAKYSSGSWARLVNGSDDRVATTRSLIESLGGSLEIIYWAAQSGTAHAIADLPDELAAKAVVTAVFETGAFASVEAEELLTQEQLRDTLVLTRSAQEFYEAPGKPAVDSSYR